MNYFLHLQCDSQGLVNIRLTTMLLVTFLFIPESIELVSFVTSDHPTTCADPYSEHQRVVPKSKSVAAPALTTKCRYEFCQECIHSE